MLDGIQDHPCLPIPFKYLEFEEHDKLVDELKKRVSKFKDQMRSISGNHLAAIDLEVSAKSDLEACEEKVEKRKAELRALERCQARAQRPKAFSN